MFKQYQTFVDDKWKLHFFVFLWMWSKCEWMFAILQRKYFKALENQLFLLVCSQVCKFDWWCCDEGLSAKQSVILLLIIGCTCMKAAYLFFICIKSLSFNCCNKPFVWRNKYFYERHISKWKQNLMLEAIYRSNCV